MNRTTLLSLVTILVFAISLLAPLAATTTIAAAQEKGPAADKLEWKRVPLDQVPQAFDAGDIDVYIFGLKPALAQELAGRPGIKLYTAPAGLVDMGLNPAPVMIVKLEEVIKTKEEAAARIGVDPVVVRYIEYNETAGWTKVELCAKPASLPVDVTIEWESEKLDINPFCFREIRFALNYVVDRERIVKDLYKGFAIAKYTFYGPDDPVYTELVDLVAKYKFTYQPSLADRIITEVLTKAGAEKRGGMWYYNDKPITIIGIIRTEDERYDIGSMFAAELRRLGFAVQPQYQTFFEAIMKVYYTDPKDFEWMFYTEGWGKGAIDKWDPWNLAQFAASWLGWAPGWGEPAYWNWKPELKDEYGNDVDFYSKATALMEGITSREQWIEYLRRGTELGTLESIRIWVAARMSIYPAREDLRGVTVDLGGGLRSLFNFRGWHVPGQDVVRVGHLWAWTTRSVWNIFGGFDDVYSVDPMRATMDPGIWRHPFNGEPIPFRFDFTVETAGPDGTLTIPDDAIWWDAENDKWVYAKELGRTEAISKVVFDLTKFIGSKWHHGVEITFADILALWAEWLDIVYDPEKSGIESAIASTNKDIYDKMVAIRPLPGEGKLEVYLNYWHFDPAYIADFAVLTPSIPAELVIFHDYVAFVTKERALDETRAKRDGIPQLSLVLKDDAELVKTYFEGELGANGYEMYKSYFTLPDGTVLMTSEEWSQRVQAVIDWVNTYGLAWISQGPFKLVKFDKDAQYLELEAFRDPTYPFGPTDWVFGEPQPTQITGVFAPVVAPGEAATITVQVAGVPPIHVKYLIRDPATGQVIAAGEAEPAAAGFVIELPAEVTAQFEEYTAYELTVIAYSEEIALPAEHVAVLQTTAAIAQRLQEIGQQLQEVQSRFQEQLQQVQRQIQAQLQEQLSGLREALGAQVAEALGGLSMTLQEGLEGLTTTMQQSMEGLSSTLQEGLNSLQETVGTVEGRLSALEGKIATKDDVAAAKAAAENIASTLTVALALSAINLVLLLVVIVLLLRRR